MRVNQGLVRTIAASVLVCAGLAAVPTASAKPGGGAGNGGAGGATACQLSNGIKHVIYIQFDNTHLTRDNPNVPSDLEQMPHLMNFLENNGTLLNKQYTVLISHTAAGMLSSLTGLYPDRMGITVSNSYDYYNQQTGVPTFTSAFKYWTAPVASPVDTNPNLVNGDSGRPQTTPAPWVTYTRAGCDVGYASMANTVLENANAAKFAAGPSDLFAAAKAGDMRIDPFSTRGFTPGMQITIDQGANQETAVVDHISGFFIYLTSPLTKAHAKGVEVWGPSAPDPSGDLTTVFGAGSPQWQEGFDSQTAPFGSAAAAKAATDFEGIAIHCAQSPSSICAGNPNARPDVLPDEPGGYDGYQALFGAKYVNPAITGGSPAVADINGAPITDGFGQPGFPGFDAMPASTTLGYVAQMQESGIPITYAYISDAHDDHTGGGAFGPGETGYVNQLKSYDDAFAKFFDRLAADGLNSSNTLFVFTADENDNFAGEQAQNCDGVTTPCQYNTVASTPHHGQYDLTNGGTSVGPASWPPAGTNGPLVGEVGYNMSYLLGSKIDNTGYDISFDSAPSFYIDGQPQAVDQSGNVAVNPLLRDFEHAAANLKAFDPYYNEQQGLPRSSTQLTSVANYLVDAPTLKALHMINADPQRTMSFTMFSKPDFYFQTFSPCKFPSQGCVNDGFAWIHGDYANQIGQTWLGMVGPGVRSAGLDDSTWTDHTDIVPTVNALVGLQPDYTPDGRVITQALAPSVAGGGNGESFQQLGDMYKQLDAPYGAFAHSLIVASTNGIESTDNTVYVNAERAIQSLTAQRDALVLQIRSLLTGGSDGHREQLIQQGQALLDQAAQLAGS